MRAVITFALLVACSPASGREPLPQPPAPRITAVRAPTPILTGTLLEVRGLGLDRVGTNAQLVVQRQDGEWSLAESSTALSFGATDALIDGLHEGMHDVTMIVRGDLAESEPFETSLVLSSGLPLALDAGFTGNAHFEDALVLHGAGFTTETEGPVSAHVVGTFAPSAGVSASIDVVLPMTLADATARDRALLVLGTELGGPQLLAGHLVGTLALVSTAASGTVRTTPPSPFDVTFVPPELFAIDPDVASIGRIATVRGAGFLGRADRADETTLLRFDATFTPEGGAATPFTMELVPTWVSGAEVGLVIDAHVQDATLVASLFGAQRGVLQGTATAITLRGTSQLEGVATPLTLTLAAPTQVVQLQFLSGWYDVLTRMGLAAAEAQVLDAIVARIESLYAGHALDVRTTTVTDYAQDAYAVVEIGGPDPNGTGLFGYDAGAGKDAGNLRLFDRIGGAHTVEQSDGYPGYGGVFVESMLWWSSHPELDGDRPSGAPPPDPLFDQVFDAVRAEPATYDEAMGVGASDRVALVAHAIQAFANLVGETTAHELGHSLGLAQPFGDPAVFHDPGDGDGCLMDNGIARPLGERMGEPGFTPSHFCYDGPAYLDLILAME